MNEHDLLILLNGLAMGVLFGGGLVAWCAWRFE